MIQPLGISQVAYAVSKNTAFDFSTLRANLLQLIDLYLEPDPTLIPALSSSLSSTSTSDASTEVKMVGEDVTTASDDFRFWPEQQGRRILYAIKMAFGVGCCICRRYGSDGEGFGCEGVIGVSWVAGVGGWLG